MRRMAFAAFDLVLASLGKLAYALYHLLGRRLVFLLGKFTGFMIYITDRKLRELTKRELALLFGKKFTEEQLEGITRRSIEHYYTRNIETFFLGALDRENILRIIKVDGLENLEKSLSGGKGVILLLSHFGSFLLPLPFLGYKGYKVNQITGKQLHRSGIEERIWAWRKKEAEKLPVKFLQVDKFLRPIYIALGNNEIVALAFDGRDGSKWVEVDFFERKALFSSGPFELARRTNAAIVPAFVVRGRDFTHRLVFEKPFGLFEDADVSRALNIDTRNFAGLLAKYIDLYPCHFGWLLFKIQKLQNAGIPYTLFREN